ncbi:protease SohB [Suttonella ornithocola]|uniref:Probable protease sohB n=1 Tax=Suttonella ornithocola TaxID=279832 RepID=A0A380MK10_9GAMM|nr:protease SohB [Suttonella ornithocola]SUO92999.1 Probable protease sohB [Suttonella ornithocola]
MTYLWEYGLFFAKTFTIIIALIILIVSISVAKRHHNEDNKFKLTSLNTHYENMREQLLSYLLDKKAWKTHQKELKKAEKNKDEQNLPRLFILDFDGDIAATAVDTLREQISAILQVAKTTDKVLIRLESGGGYVHAYGLAASQLIRLKEKSIPLTICVDKVAASGGYMMACVADELIAAPFAIIGSIGVIGAIPNFHDLLEKNHIHYEQHTAGKHKRSLTVFGENTDEDRAQFQKELNETHFLFKEHITLMRPNLDIDTIATGETWYGKQAINKGLIDKIQTSDDYLLSHCQSHQMLLLEEDKEENFISRLKSRFLGKIQNALYLKNNLPFKAKIY